ncbi:hypothetical protein [Mesorhizobium jarvisii]|uniref:hypothetical protein n=1 Tax=Mesorhizobium jarvisii TaxID=1777867 RepID=UPI001F0B2592|nr:hypothetical protein [Mesorhizobium jarvisii]MCH4560337.1 hypothetical protein [Mesorhizobium jarvisii]
MVDYRCAQGVRIIFLEEQTMSIRFKVDPGDVPPEKAARRLGISLERFLELLPRLLSRGFPPSDPDTGNYDLDAIDVWRAARHRPIAPDLRLPAARRGIVAERLKKLYG